MGCRSLPYWLGTLMFDYLAYIISYLIMVLIIYSMGLTFMTNYIWRITIIMIFFGFAMIQFSYAIGFLFNKGTTAFKIFPLIGYFLFYSVPMGVIMAVSETDYNKPLQILVYCISPFYLLNIGKYCYDYFFDSLK
jgi:ATP-binding cassette, subfamily A (ABC1), member 3